MQARVPAGAVRAVFFDQVRALAEPPVIFGVVAGRFGDIVIEVEEHLIADNFLFVDFGIFADRFADQRVGILTLPFVLQIPGHVIYSSAGISDVFIIRANPFGQHHRGALYAVAKPGDLYLAFVLHGAAEHSHWVGIVEHGGVGAVDAPCRE